MLSSVRPSARYAFARLLCVMRTDALFGDPSATLDDLREAVMTYTELERTARRVFGNVHPTVLDIGKDLRNSRKDLARLGEDSDKAVMMALAFVAAVAFLAGRRYLRR